MSSEHKGKSAQQETRTAEIHIRRGGPEDSPRFDVFQVARKETMSVLDALIWIRQHLDSSVAVRYSCINANACKECGALVNGNASDANHRLAAGDVLEFARPAGEKGARA